MGKYHYTACGLDNVFIIDLDPLKDDAGEETICILGINVLHKAIAEAIIRLPSSMNGKELRFLRSELGLTQAELAKLVKKEALTVSRWEREENPIDQSAEVILRLLVRDRLNLEHCISIDSIIENVMPSTGSRVIDIDGSTPGKYRPVAA